MRGSPGWFGLWGLILGLALVGCQSNSGPAVLHDTLAITAYPLDITVYCPQNPRPAPLVILLPSNDIRNDRVAGYALRLQQAGYAALVPEMPQNMSPAREALAIEQLVNAMRTSVGYRPYVDASKVVLVAFGNRTTGVCLVSERAVRPPDVSILVDPPAMGTDIGGLTGQSFVFSTPQTSASPMRGVRDLCFRATIKDATAESLAWPITNADSRSRPEPGPGSATNKLVADYMIACLNAGVLDRADAWQQLAGASSDPGLTTVQVSHSAR